MRAVTLAPAKAGSHLLDELPEAPETPSDFLVRALLVGVRGTDGELVGLMEAVMGVQRGLEVQVMDRNESGPKPALVRELGASYHREYPAIEPDIVIESTGSAAVIVQAVSGSARGSIVCLTGLGGGQLGASFDVAKLNQSMVLENRVVFGTVNANLRHYLAAADALSHASRAWLDKLITRRVGLKNWHEAYEKRLGDVKTVLLFED